MAYCHEKRVQSYNNLTKPPSFLKTFYPFPVYFTLLRHYNSSHKPHMKRILTPNCSTSCTFLNNYVGTTGRNPVPNGEFLRTKQGVSGRLARIERPGKNITTPVEKRYRGRGKINTRSCKTLPLIVKVCNAFISFTLQNY